MSSTQPRRWRRLLAVMATLVAAVAVAPQFAGVANAHHSEISATVSCAGVISWTASSWTTGLDGANSDIRVFMDPDNAAETQIGSGVFPNQNTIASFSGTVNWPAGANSVIIRSKPYANWGNGNTSRDGRSVTINKPTNCPGTPTVTYTKECVNTSPGNGDGKVVVTLTNPAGTFGASVVFKVYALDTSSGGTTNYTVATGGSTTHTFSGISDGSHTYTIKAYKADGTTFIQTFTQTFTIDCDTPQPSATITSACASGDGKITVTLTNSGGEAVTFTVITPSGATESHTVNANSNKVVNYTGLADGSYTVTAKVGSTVIATQTVTIDCDQPNPGASISQSCVSNDGKVVLTLTNTGTEGVTFTVKHPVTGASENIVVAAGGTATRTYSGLNDGSYVIQVSAPGFPSMNQSFTVDCDQNSTVSHSYECVAGDGKVVVTMHNNGDDVAVTFVVAGTTYVVPANSSQTHTVNGLADGSQTITVTIDGVPANITVVVDCDEPGTPEVASSQECVAEDGKVVLTLKNVGGELPLTFTVNGTPYVVNANSQQAVTFANLSDGVHSFTITVVTPGGVVDLSKTFTVDCDQDPTVQHTYECSDEPNGISDGVVTITLYNNGDDVSITFNVDGQSHTVAPESSKQVVIDGLSDGPHSIPVSGGGKNWTIEVTVDCDHPGEGSISVAQVCFDKDGKVTVTLTATGGEEAVVFTVNGENHSVAPNTTKDVVIAGLSDGTFHLTITTGAITLFDDDLLIDCDPAPGFTYVPACSNLDGSVVFSLTNNGDDLAVTFTVNGTDVVVQPGQTVEHTVSGLSDGTATITMAIDGVAQESVVVTVDCDPAPSYDYDTTCADGDGSFILTLTNNGDDVAVTFTVNGTDVVVQPLSTVPHIVSGLNDGQQTVTLAIDGVEQSDIVATFDCDGASSYSHTTECSNLDGQVTVALTNGGDDAAVTFTVNGTDVVVQPGQTVDHVISGLADGQHTFTMAIDGVPQDPIKVEVDCDPAPTYDYDTACAEGDGAVTLTLNNNGDDLAVTFTINGTDVIVQPLTSVEHVVDGLNDGQSTITLAIDGVGKPNIVVTFDCDGESTYSVSTECSEFDGQAVFSLTNGGDDVAVTFTVDGTDVVVQPGATVEHIVGGLADGQATVTLSIDGEAQPDVEVEVDCDPTPGVEAVCNTVDGEGDVSLYWFEVTNTEAVELTLSIGGKDVTLAPGASTTVSSATAPLTVLFDGVEVASAAATAVVCEREVTFEKDLAGEPATGETYTVRVSRLNDDATYTEEVTFDIEAGVPVTITLPSTLDPSGIEYLVEEIDPGTALVTQISPSELQLAGHLGETVSVVITNGYAGVEIVKQSLTGTVQAGGTITYTLQAVNTGGLTLDPVVIYDRLPVQTEMVSVAVQDNAGLCNLTETGRPQLVTCVMDDALAPGGVTKTITLVVKVDAGVLPGTQILNQAKALGTWDIPELDGDRHEQTGTGEVGNGLSCEPIIQGTVCDLSAVVAVPVAEGGQGGPTTTAATTTTIRRGLPATGGGGSAPMMLLAGLVMAGAGAVMLLLRRRPAGR